MITNFEEITEELTDKESNLIPILVAGLKFYSKDNPIKEPDIVMRMNNKGYQITGARLRKLVNYIRTNSIAPIIATSKGYYFSTDKEEIEKQIRSLEERASGIYNAAAGLRKFI